MLLTNRRHRLLHLAVAGMEVGWIAPWALLLIRFWQRRLAVTLLEESGALETVAALDNIRSMPPVAFFLLLFVLMIVYMLAADMLNQRQIDSPLRELIMLALGRGHILGGGAHADLPDGERNRLGMAGQCDRLALQLHGRAATGSDRVGHQRFPLVPRRLQHRPRPDLFRRRAQLPPRSVDLCRRRGAFVRHRQPVNIGVVCLLCPLPRFRPDRRRHCPHRRKGIPGREQPWEPTLLCAAWPRSCWLFC